MTRPTYLIDDHPYNKSQLLDALRDIIHGHRPGTRLDAATTKLVCKIIAISPKADKLDDGVAGIVVRQHPMGQSCLYLVRPTGREEDFSYKKLFDVPSPEARAQGACRVAAHPSVQAFRAAVDPRRCQVGYHVDHSGDWPFVRIARTFLERHPHHPTRKMELDSRSVWVFEDASLARKFREYHDEVAVLQLIPALENMRKGSSGW